jgi:hypothetical protein
MVPYPWNTKNRGSLRRRFNEWIVEDASATKRSEFVLWPYSTLARTVNSLGGLFRVEQDPVTDEL